MALKERGAITGIGETAYSRNSGKSVVALQMEASLAAIADAGLTPNIVAIVDLEDGVRMNAQMRGVTPGEMRIGLPVQVTFERTKEGVTLPALVRTR
jgi:uncharacterized OB-fold protein